MTTPADLQANNQAEHNTGEKGFTLIELLITFTIISILSMVGLPVYQNYSIRSKISADFTQMRHLMLNMNEKYALNGQWPATNAEAGAYEPERYNGKYLMSAEISDSPQPGTMTLTYNVAEIPVLRDTNTIVFYPDQDVGRGNWKCNQGTIPAKYRPSNCR